MKRQYSYLPNKAFGNGAQVIDGNQGYSNLLGINFFGIGANKRAQGIECAGTQAYCTSDSPSNPMNETADTTTIAPITAPALPVSTDSGSTNGGGTPSDYAGSGIGSGAINAISPNFNFGNVPSIASIIGGTTNTTVAGTTTPAATASSTNWILYGVIAAAAIGGGFFLLKKIRQGKAKK